MMFLGLDLGYLLFACLEKPNPNTLAYILVEKDLNVFHHMLHVADISHIARDPRFHFIIGVPQEELFTVIRQVLDTEALFTAYKATAVESSSTSYAIHAEYYKSYLLAFRDAVKDLITAMGNAPQDSITGIKHILLNLKTIAHSPGVIDLFNKFSGRPGIIVATGPSLDKNYHLLHEVTDRAVIFSADASLKFLLSKGIRPHFVTSVERVAATLPFFEGLTKEECKDTVQVAFPVVLPELYAAFPGLKAIAYRNQPQFKWLGVDKGSLAVGPSTANLAFALAVAMGCNPIILIGQDLAFGEDGATHGSAAAWGRHHPSIRTDRPGTLRRRGNVSEWVLTYQPWEDMRLAYVRDVAAYPGTVINATEGGAYIEGTVVKTFRQAIDEHIGDPFPVRDQVFGALRIPTEEEAQGYLHWLRSQRVPEILRCLEEAIEKARGLAKDGWDVLKDPGADTRIPPALRKMFMFHREMFGGSLLSQAGGILLQPTYTQVMIEFHDTGNRFEHAGRINRARLEIQTRFMEQTAAILERLRETYERLGLRGQP